MPAVISTRGVTPMKELLSQIKELNKQLAVLKKDVSTIKEFITASEAKDMVIIDQDDISEVRAGWFW